jgi:ABC-2 type transport system ATP-binding protein
MDYLAGLRIRSLVSHPPTLEELFLRQFGGSDGVPQQEPAR